MQEKTDQAWNDMNRLLEGIWNDLKWLVEEIYDDVWGCRKCGKSAS